MRKSSVSASSRVRQERRWTSSIFSVERKFATSALSQESPIDPVEGGNPLSANCSANRTAVRGRSAVAVVAGDLVGEGVEDRGEPEDGLADVARGTRLVDPSSS
ncbi:hypothetical protein JOF53_006623 [Crossiella equi]|uniref:Uncharacterized protein n=1 Tax=Crossiella equi TaxID=130796 RepID=A0ABS5AMG5_9PSEU|nr:hypothetical protein [Crossiella equi]MBP2477751.1 hypothetical protein [Crossiella equi]